MYDITKEGHHIPMIGEPTKRQEYGVEGIREASDAADFIRSLFDIGKLQQETFIVLALDGANKPIRTCAVTDGLLDTNMVHPREVFAPVLVARAGSIIVAHNHPSGTLEPSPEDIALTKRLVECGKLLGIRVLDHLILTAEGFISLKERGAM